MTATTVAAAPTAAAVHAVTTRLSIQDVAETLQDVLGQRLTAHLAGLADPKAIGAYARGEREPRTDAETRLRLAHQALQIVVDADSDHVARAWFIGQNPQLDNDAPAEAIRDGRLKEVLVAAHAFVRS